MKLNIFGKKAAAGAPGAAPDLTIDDVPSVDGPGAPIEINPAPPGTKRLSSKSKFVMSGFAFVLISAIFAGIFLSGQKNSAGGGSAKAKAQAAADAPGQTAPYRESPETIQRRAEAAQLAAATAHSQQPDGQQTGDLTTRASTGKPGAGGTSAAGGTTPPTPKEAHKAWLEKHRYERIQQHILDAEITAAAALTSDFSKGGAGLMAKAGGMAGMAGGADGLMADIGQKLAAANSRAAGARTAAATEGMRMPMPGAAGAAGGYMPASLSAAGVGQGQEPAVAAQARNKAFLKEAADNGYLPELLKPKMGEFELTAGSVIPAVMLSGINSDLPGTIVAQVRQTVYSTNEPDAVVIPQGSRLIGRYSADVAYGQSRVLAAWDEMILPNGSRIALKGMSAADGQGQSGMEDQVNNHFWKTWSSALLVSMLGVAAQQSQPQNQGAFNTSSGSAQAAAAAMNSLSDVGSKILQKSLNISPTLQVRPGMAFNVMVNRSIILPMYR